MFVDFRKNLLYVFHYYIRIRSSSKQIKQNKKQRARRDEVPKAAARDCWTKGAKSISGRINGGGGRLPSCIFVFLICRMHKLKTYKANTFIFASAAAALVSNKNMYVDDEQKKSTQTSNWPSLCRLAANSC